MGKKTGESKTVIATSVVDENSQTNIDSKSGHSSEEDDHIRACSETETEKESVLQSDGNANDTSEENKTQNNELETKSIEYKNVSFEVKEINDEDPEFFTFEGFASTFGNIDHGDDIVERGAFIETLKEMMPKLLWQHRMDEPLGIYTFAEERDQGLFVRGKMPKSDDFVRGRVIPQLKVGSIDSMSIGFSILEESIKKTPEGRSVRVIEKVRLFEVSLVTIPMNPRAVVTGMKSADFLEMAKMADVSDYLRVRGHNHKETNQLISTIKRIARDELSSRDEKEALKKLGGLVYQLKQQVKGKNNV